MATPAKKTVTALINQVTERRLPGRELEPVLKDVLVTSTWFSPEFPLKTKLRDLAKALAKGEKGASS